jgi:hypothetical protein
MLKSLHCSLLCVQILKCTEHTSIIKCYSNEKPMFNKIYKLYAVIIEKIQPND